MQQQTPNIYNITAKQIFTPTKIPGIKYAINQYVGCQYACLYCYAKFMCRWKNYGDWGDWIEVKENAPDLARKFVPGKVTMSSVSDAYQPIENRLELTKRVLQNMDKHTNLSILTKSNLVTRDIDIFHKFDHIEIGLTLNGFTGDMKKLFEPLAPTHQARLHAIESLSNNNITTFAFISPVIPSLVNIESIISETREFVDYYIVELINMAAGGNKFRKALSLNYPESYRILRNREKLAKFTSETREILRKSNVRVLPLITHYH